MQLLYEQMMGGEGGGETLDGLIGYPRDEEDLRYIETIVAGVASGAAALDGVIALHSAKRELGRIPVVVRAILRLSLYELMFLRDVPVSVVINEAVELARMFAQESDGRFINGVLGAYVREIPAG